MKRALGDIVKDLLVAQHKIPIKSIWSYKNVKYIVVGHCLDTESQQIRVLYHNGKVLFARCPKIFEEKMKKFD